MQNALILHGRNCTPDLFWYQWIGKELEKQGYSVDIPLLPENTSADRKIWVPYILENFTFDSSSVVITHSSSGVVFFEVLENLDVKIDKLILVAGFISPLLDTPSHPALKEAYDWDKIRRSISNLYIINSDTDSTGADMKKGREIFEKLGGTQIIMHNQAHFGSIKHNQPYKEFPLLKKLTTD